MPVLVKAEVSACVFVLVKMDPAAVDEIDGTHPGLDEFANFCAVFLDGTSRFQTGQFFTYAGGW
jgi:hypothetical protein